MANKLVIGWPVYSDSSVLYSPVLSGGSWLAALPLTNLQNRELAKVARSADDALTSTIINWDLGVARSVRLIGIPVHNFSTAAKIRSRAWTAVPVLEDNDFNAWTSTGTPVVTTGQTDPFSGTRATLLEDNDAAAAEYKSRLVTFIGNGVKHLGLTLKAGTAGVTEFEIEGAIQRHRVRATWTGGVPSLSTIGGSGTLYTPIALGGGWYFLHVSVNGVVAADTNRFYLAPAGFTAGNTGTVTAYEALLWDTTTETVLYDSGVVDAWPSGVTAEDADGMNVGYYAVLSAAVSARYGRIEIADTSNPDNYVEIGRLAICGGYEPTYHPRTGLQFGWETSSSREETDGGAFLHLERRRRRVLGFEIGDLALTEALGTPFRLGQRAGTHGQLVVVRDPDDATQLHKWSFLATQQQMPRLTFPYYHRANWPVTLVEEL